MVIFCRFCACGQAAATSASATTTRTRFITGLRILSRGALRRGGGLRDLQVEQLPGVVLENRLLVGVRQPVDRLDREARFVEPAAGAWILHRAHPGTFGPEQA